MMIVLSDIMAKKHRKATKAHIEEALIPIASNPTKMQHWCMAEDEQKNIKEKY